MTPDELATLANITIRADICKYEGNEWKKCIRDLQNLINGRKIVALEILSRLRNNLWQKDTMARCVLNFYLELNFYASQYIDSDEIHLLERV